MMFAYGPELYELHSWGAGGDGDLLLDNHTQATNLLSCKLEHMYGRAGSNEPSPCRVTSPAGKDSKSICQDDSETNGEGGDEYEYKATENGEGQDDEDTDTKSSKESSSDTGESSCQSSHSSLETDGEIQACTVSPAKEIQGDTSAKEDKANHLKSPHPPSWPDTMTRILKRSRNVSVTRMPGFWTTTSAHGMLT